MIIDKMFLLLAQVDISPLPDGVADQNSISNILSIVFAITGSIALLMVVIGGLRYILAHGDSGAVASAKNTILYAIIGLVISLTAFSIVNLAVNGLTT